MHWKVKNAAFWALAGIPGAGGMLRTAAQRFITGRYYQQLTPPLLAAYQFHIDNFNSLPKGCTALEFGVGRNLLASLLLSAAGAREVFAYDIARIATVGQINDTIRQLREVLPGRWPAIDRLDDLALLYRVHYHAPGDAGATALPPRSVDFFCSTSVLEHVPAAEIRKILQECRRIASEQALMSFIVDYHDHYSTADTGIGRFNFYRYTASEWRFYNPPMQFQSRLRHCDYLELFDDFEIVGSRRILQPEELRVGVPLAPEFSHYAPVDLYSLNGLFVLRARSQRMCKSEPPSPGAACQR